MTSILFFALIVCFAIGMPIAFSLGVASVNMCTFIIRKAAAAGAIFPLHTPVEKNGGWS